MNKRCHAKATMRKSGQKCLTVPVSFSLNMDEILLAYLLAKGARQWISADENTHLSSMPIPANKTEAFNAIATTLNNYGSDFYYREEEMPEDWDKDERVLNIKSKLIELFGF
jgi:hypothetical protein